MVLGQSVKHLGKLDPYTHFALDTCYAHLLLPSLSLTALFEISWLSFCLCLSWQTLESFWPLPQTHLQRRLCCCSFLLEGWDPCPWASAALNFWDEVARLWWGREDVNAYPDPTDSDTTLERQHLFKCFKGSNSPWAFLPMGICQEASDHYLRFMQRPCTHSLDV